MKYFLFIKAYLKGIGFLTFILLAFLSTDAAFAKKSASTSKSKRQPARVTSKKKPTKTPAASMNSSLVDRIVDQSCPGSLDAEAISEILSSQEANQAKISCNDYKPNKKVKNGYSTACLVNLFNLASNIFTIKYSLIQCMMAKESSDASFDKTLLLSSSPIKYSKKIAPYNIRANTNGNKGIGQIRQVAVNELARIFNFKSSGKENYDCALKQKFQLFFEATDKKQLPSSILPKTSKNNPKTIPFNYFNPLHNVAVAVSYMHLMKTRHTPKNVSISDQKSKEIIALNYNASTIKEDYTEKVKACSAIAEPLHRQIRDNNYANPRYGNLNYNVAETGSESLK